MVSSLPVGKGFKAPPVVFNMSTDTMPLIVDVHIIVIRVESRCHCLQKDCDSLSSSAEGHPQALLGQPVDSISRSHLPPLSSFGHNFRRVCPEGLLHSSGLVLS